MRALVVWLMLAGAASGQGVVGGIVQGLPQATPRDPRPSLTTGTGVIAGRVTTADTGLPVRRALVTLSGVGHPRATFTDEEGRYRFERVPKGTYSVGASAGLHRATYQNASYGQRAPLTPPLRFDLGEGQVLETVDIALPRGAAIAVRVTDAYGEPAARVQVSAMLLTRGSPPMQRAGGSTDDLGQVRLFGLVPGEYIVRAESRGGIGVSSAAELEGEPMGFAPTYAPGTASQQDALRVRVAPGVQAAVDIRLVETRVFTVSGQVISSSGDSPSNVNVALGYPQGTSFTSFGVSMQPNGRFVIRNVPPGSYVLTARSMAPRQPGAAPGPIQVQEMASLRIDVGMADVENVVVQLAPGQTLTGRIVFEEGAPAQFRAVVSATVPERQPLFVQPRIDVKGDTFVARDLFSPILLRGSVSGTPGATWALKAVLLDGRDITDVPVAFGAAHSGRVQLLFTSRVSSLEGRVLDDRGQPTRDAAVLIFAADEASWTPYSSRIRFMGLSNPEGTFMARGLREGRYYAVAVPPEVRLVPQSPDPELLESLKQVATEVVLNVGETRSVELHVVRFER